MPENSTQAQYKNICTQPASGTFETAPRPFGMSANLSPMEGDSSPGSFPVISGVMYPMHASIEMRPCLISDARRRLKFSSEPSRVNPNGSQKPTGGCTPNSDSKAASAVFTFEALLRRVLPLEKTATAAPATKPAHTAGKAAGAAGEAHTDPGDCEGVGPPGVAA